MYGQQYSKKGKILENQALAIGQMNSALKEMVQVLECKTNDKSHGLEKISVPSWDGQRRTYNTWKHEFTHWMKKYNQDNDEQLQRFRKALPKNWRSDEVKSCKTIEQAWEILDLEFGNKRKLMDDLLKDITDYKPVRSDSESLSRYATKITAFVKDMNDSGCNVDKSGEAPFVMSQLLSKLDPKDNVEFGREMFREHREENANNLIAWLHREATLRSRAGRERRIFERTEQRAASNVMENDVIEELCPLGCQTRHLLTACPIFQGTLTVDQRWEVVRRHNRCRKCFRTHHTNECRKPDGTTCDQCTRRHHH